LNSFFWNWTQDSTALVPQGPAASDADGTGVAVSGDASTLIVGVPGASASAGEFLPYQDYATPAVTSVSPGTGPTVGGTTVVVTGSGFVNGQTTVTIGGHAVAPTNVTSTSLTIVTPVSPLGGANGSGVAQVVVTTPGGSSTTSSASGFTYIAAGSYVPITPFRVLDTRLGSCVQCNTNPQFGPGSVEPLQVTGFGAGNIPANASAVVLNVVAVAGTQPSYLTVYPTGSAMPLASSLNFGQNTNLANLAQVALGPGGQVNIYNDSGSVNVVVDVEGYFTPTATPTVPIGAGLFHTVTPVRVCDTRGGGGTACNSGTDNPLGPGQTRLVQIAGLGGIPTTASGTAAVALNLTAVSGTSGTFLSLYPATGASCDPPPTASTINVGAATNLANRTMVTVSAAGDVCVYNSLGTINFIIDANGWFGDGTEASVASGSYFFAMAPVRTCDTRSGTLTQCSGTGIGPQGHLSVTVAGVGGVPTAGSANPPVAVVANVTAVSGSAATFFTVYPANVARPTASDLNVGPTTNLANLVVTQLGGGAVCIYSDQGNYDAVVDISGWYGT
jgi:hypothetical protein